MTLIEKLRKQWECFDHIILKKKDAEKLFQALERSMEANKKHAETCCYKCNGDLIAAELKINEILRCE